jgi:uncharacterized protein
MNSSGFEPRFYRSKMGEGRFVPFTIGYKDSDLWIGIDSKSYNTEIQDFAQRRLVELRQSLELYILNHPLFATSFVPIELLPGAPEIAKIMSIAGLKTGTGPMAAVAGAFSEFIGKAVQAEFGVEEIVVENGGDIYLSLKRDLLMSVYAGDSPLSGKLGVQIPAHYTPLGVCTSAGTVGPSINFGKADAVMVICKDTALADAYATAISNKIKLANDIPIQQQFYSTEQEIISLLMICQGQIGISGQFEIKPIKSVG